MATYNTTTKHAMRTTNRSGHEAYRLDDKTKLVTMALTTMLGEPKYYGDNTDELIQLAEKLCKSGQGEFVAKLAVWARTKGNLRSVSHALIAVCGHWCSGQVNTYGESFVRKAARVIASMRGDDGTEMIATSIALYGKPLSHALTRGIRDALEAETPFQVAKYQSQNRSVKLRDTLRITHPNAMREDTVEAMGKVIDGTLPMPKSWETELSARGNTAEVWNELIAENKVGIFALVRNLRNIIKSGANIDPVLDKLYDRQLIAKSRMLPFRFWEAYRELSGAGLATSKVNRALDAALVNSCRNADPLPGKTAVLIDRSGSMSAQVSRKSKATCIDIAAVLGAMVTHISDDAAVFWFSNDAGVIPMSGMSVISDVQMVPVASGGTDMAAGFDRLMQASFDADRVIVLSDNEVNGIGWWRSCKGSEVIQRKMDEYRRKVGHDVWCHAIDLQGLGTSQFAGPKTNIMAGWSSEVIKYIALTEAGVGSIADAVESIQL